MQPGKGKDCRKLERDYKQQEQEMVYRLQGRETVDKQEMGCKLLVQEKACKQGLEKVGKQAPDYRKQHHYQDTEGDYLALGNHIQDLRPDIHCQAEEMACRLVLQWCM